MAEKIYDRGVVARLAVAVVVLSAAAAVLSPAASTRELASVHRVLAQRSTVVQGVRLRYVVSTTNLDTRRNGRVALWLTSYVRTSSGWKRSQRVRVATGFKLSSKLRRFKLTKVDPESVDLFITWYLTPAVGSREFTYGSDETGRLAPID
jgi:hypothetical protein